MDALQEVSMASLILHLSASVNKRFSNSFLKNSKAVQGMSKVSTVGGLEKRSDTLESTGTCSTQMVTAGARGNSAESAA